MPRSLTHVVSAFLKEWGVTLHKLRQSHASQMLAANVHPEIVQERLGHSSIAITLLARVFFAPTLLAVVWGQNGRHGHARPHSPPQLKPSSRNVRAPLLCARWYWPVSIASGPV